MSLASQTTLIRDRINTGRMQRSLRARPAEWNVLCSALDVIEDTDLALLSYLAFTPQSDIGSRYLLVYGSLQALQTQQDAALALCTALDIKPANAPKIPGIREVRSDAVGHPMSRKEDRVTKSSFIVRMSLSDRGFALLTLNSAGTRHEERHVDIPLLVRQQSEVLQATLDEVLNAMDAEEAKHREAHRETKLADAFSAVLPYHFSKIHEAIGRSDYFGFGGPCLEFVFECLERFKDLLTKRNEWDVYDSVSLGYDQVIYPLEELRKYFARSSSKLNEKDAVIFCDYARRQIESLEQIALEIDEEYASPPGEDRVG